MRMTNRGAVGSSSDQPGSHRHTAINFNSTDMVYVGEENRGAVRLWAAVILQAVTDYSRYRISQEYGSTKRKDLKGIELKRGREAMMWLFGEPSDSPRTFNWACQMLNLDPDRARRVIKRDWLNLAKINARDSTSYDSENEAAPTLPPTRQTKYRNKKYEDNKSMDVVA